MGIRLEQLDANKGFTQCFNFTQKWEGGAKVTKDPDDPGGTTKYGISQRAHPTLNVEKLTEDDAKSIYFQNYWRLSGAKDLPWPACLVMFDNAVNLGNTRARRIAIQANFDWSKMIDLREQYYHDLVEERPVMKKYIKGWLNRTKDLREEASKE